MTDRYLVNVSSIQSFMDCRWRWVATWLCNRVPRETPKALTFGKVLHEVFEDHFNGQPMPAAIARVRSRWDGDETLDELAKFEEVLCQWRDQYPLGPALEVEEPFEVPHPKDNSIILRGRPDRVAPLWGRIYHIQNRGLARGTNFAMYTELAKRHYHEHVYAYAIGMKYPNEQYGGTVMNLLRKLQYRGKGTKANPKGKVLHPVEEMLWQGIVTITPEATARILDNIKYWVDEMRQVEWRFRSQGEWPAPNEKLNAGFYGSRIDPYFYVLQGERSLDDDTYFMAREDTYADVPQLDLN